MCEDAAREIHSQEISYLSPENISYWTKNWGKTYGTPLWSLAFLLCTVIDLTLTCFSKDIIYEALQNLLLFYWNIFPHKNVVLLYLNTEVTDQVLAILSAQEAITEFFTSFCFTFFFPQDNLFPIGYLLI